MNKKSSALKENKIKNSKILLLIKNTRNMDLLSKFLDKDYMTYQEFDPDINYDLILVDSYNYKTKFKLIEEFKKKQSPLFLPVILMHKREETVDYSSKMMNIANEYILTPVKKDVLKIRIKRMLKTRVLTKENFQNNNKYKKIFAQLDHMAFLNQVDLKSRKLYKFSDINKKVIEKTGYSKNELLNMKFTDIIDHNKQSPIFEYYLNKLIKENKVILQADLLKKDNDNITVEINSKIMVLKDEHHVLSILREL